MESKVLFSKKLILVNTLSGVAVKILSITVLVWLQRYLLKRISADEYSLYPVLVSVMLFLPLLSSIMTSGLSRYVIEAYAKSDGKRITQITSTMFLILSFFCTAILVFGALFSWKIDLFLTIPAYRLDDARLMMILLISDFIFTTLSMPFQMGFHVRQAFVLLNLVTLGKEIIRILALLALLFGVSTEIKWVVLSSCVANTLGTMTMVLISRRMLPSLQVRYAAIDWSVAKEITSFGGWSFLGQVAFLIGSNADPIILNKLGTSLDVTNFFLGSMPNRQITNFTSMATRPLMPQLTALHAGTMKNDLRNAYLTGNRYGLWGSLLLAVPVMVFARELTMLWVGNEYLTAATVAILLLATYPMSYGNLMIGCLAIATAQMRTISIVSIAVQVVNLIITFILVGKMGLGAIGSALATFIVTIFIQPFLMVPIAVKMADSTVSEWFKCSLLPGIIPGIMMSVVLLFLKWQLSPTSLPMVLGAMTVGFLMYIVTQFLFCLSDYDRRNLQRVYTALRNRLKPQND